MAGGRKLGVGASRSFLLPSSGLSSCTEEAKTYGESGGI